MRQIRKLFKDPRLVNHSFRHYFTNKTREAEQYLPKAAVNYITGHSIGAGERDEYGDGYPLKMTYEAMCKLDFSFLRQN
jgi:integrase